MRILQVLPYFYPAEAYGGPVPVVYNISRELVKKGHEVIVYTTDAFDSSSRQKPRYLEFEGVKVYYFRNLSNSLAWYKLFFAPGMISQLRREIRTFDVIHLQDYRTFQNIIVHYYARKHNVPYILQTHGSHSQALTSFQKTKLKRIFDFIWGHRIMKDASRLIALTQAEVEQYRSMGIKGIKEDRYEIIPNGIQLSEFENLPERGSFRSRYGLNSNQRVILFLGRIEKNKGLDLLAQAFTDLSSDFNDAKLVIAGPDDAYLPTLKKTIKELGIVERVILPGPLYGKYKLEAFVDADVFVLSSMYEAFPMSILEACACGLPVVITDRCCIADIIGEKAGLVVPYKRDVLSNAITRLLSDYDLRQRFSNYGKTLVNQKLNWSIIVPLLEDIYRSVLNNVPLKS